MEHIQQKSTHEKIEDVLEHIQNVQRNCYKLGLKMIKSGKVEFGRILIANGQIHDNSKFKGIEFDHLFANDPLLPNVAKHHSSTNPHHPEYWGSISQMPEVYIAEMVCDWAARSAEKGTSVREYIIDVQTKRYGFEIGDRVGVSIMYYIDELLSAPFKALHKTDENNNIPG